MKVLIGTTNPAKVKRFAEFLPDCGNNIYDKVEENIMVGRYRQRVVAFLKRALGIE